MTRDSQRSAVYRWEVRLVNQVDPDTRKALLRELTLRECATLVHEVWESYRGPNAKPPVVGDGRGRRSACGSRRRIALPLYARNVQTVLHEVAHSLLDGDGPWHGPKFARILVELFEDHAGLDPSFAVALGLEQRPRMVRFAHPGQCPKPLSRVDRARIEKIAVLRLERQRHRRAIDEITSKIRDLKT